MQPEHFTELKMPWLIFVQYHRILLQKFHKELSKAQVLIQFQIRFVWNLKYIFAFFLRSFRKLTDEKVKPLNLLLDKQAHQR
jgi:hypothetical protein